MDRPCCLTPEFFGGNVVELARDLIGRELIVHANTGVAAVRAVILETEAYSGVDDPASHAAFRPGGRAALMFGPPGFIYIYAAYGMYPCFNVVTGDDGVPSAVLVRAVMFSEERTIVSGPGRLTRRLGITLDDFTGGDLADRVSRESVNLHQSPSSTTVPRNRQGKSTPRVMPTRTPV